MPDDLAPQWADPSFLCNVQYRDDGSNQILAFTAEEAERHTADEYSNAVGRERLPQAAAER